MPRTGLTAEQVKERAIALAAEKMAVLGFSRVRLVDVARDLGVAHSVLYKHFPDKSALLDAVSEKWTRACVEAGEKIARSPRSPSKLIVDWFAAIHRMKRERVLRDPELFKAFDLAAASRKPFVAAYMTALHAQLGALVRRAIAEKEFAAGSAEKYTAFLFEITRGFNYPSMVLQMPGKDREEALKQTLKLALKALSR